MRVCRLTYLLFFFLVSVLPAEACFGPKLFVGVGSSSDQQIVFALVSLYVKEKTGTESEPVSTTGEPLDLLRQDRADLVLTRVESNRPVFLDLGEPGRLVSGPRPLEELQFTLVPLALAKLARLFRPADLLTLRQWVDNGEPVKAAARRFLTEKGWI